MKFVTSKERNSGFVVILAIIIITLILTVGIGSLNIATRDYRLARLGDSSLKALYAADTGIDCVFHLDVVGYLDSVESDSSGDVIIHPNIRGSLSFSLPGVIFSPPDESSPSFECSNIRLRRENHVAVSDGAWNGFTTYFTRIDVGDPASEQPIFIDTDSCFTINIEKMTDDNVSERTVITSNGRSPCTGAQSVERTLVLQWESI